MGGSAPGECRGQATAEGLGAAAGVRGGGSEEGARGGRGGAGPGGGAGEPMVEQHVGGRAPPWSVPWRLCSQWLPGRIAAKKSYPNRTPLKWTVTFESLALSCPPLPCVRFGGVGCGGGGGGGGRGQGGPWEALLARTRGAESRGSFPGAGAGACPPKHSRSRSVETSNGRGHATPGDVPKTHDRANSIIRGGGGADSPSFQANGDFALQTVFFLIQH